MDSILRDKSFAFATRIVRLSRFVQTEQKDHSISRQVLRSVEYVSEEQSEGLLDDLAEIISLLVKTVKTAKNNS